jgi:hypothetical protein
MNRQTRLAHYRKQLNDALRSRTHLADVVADEEGRFTVRCFDSRGKHIGGTTSLSDIRRAVSLADYYMS